MLNARLNHQATGDFEEQAALLRGWNQDYAQVSAGAFDGSVSEVEFDDMHLFLEYSSQSLFQNGKLPQHIIAVGVPLDFKGNGLFCGSACNTTSMHIFSGSSGFEFYSPTHLLMGGISVTQAALTQQLSEDEAAIVLERCAYAHLLNLAPEKTAAFREFMASAFSMLQSNPSLLEKAVTRKSLTESVLALLAECLTDGLQGNTGLAHKPVSNAKCWNIIGETKEIVSQHCDTPISVAELCQRLEISRRTLQYCFQNLLNVSPVVYLRAERLNNVRRMLKTANSVTEAAAHWGFWHFGHFSQEYKRMFGELPSVTFKRMRSLN